MTPENFCYWLQGHLEISGTKELSAAQVQMIREHLGLVFTKVTPTPRNSSEPMSAGWPPAKIDIAKCQTSGAARYYC